MAVSRDSLIHAVQKLRFYVFFNSTDSPCYYRLFQSLLQLRNLCRLVAFIFTIDMVSAMGHHVCWCCWHRCTFLLLCNFFFSFFAVANSALHASHNFPDRTQSCFIVIDCFLQVSLMLFVRLWFFALRCIGSDVCSEASFVFIMRFADIPSFRGGLFEFLTKSSLSCALCFWKLADLVKALLAKVLCCLSCFTVFQKALSAIL